MLLINGTIYIWLHICFFKPDVCLESVTLTAIEPVSKHFSDIAKQNGIQISWRYYQVKIVNANTVCELKPEEKNAHSKLAVNGICS